MLFYYLRLLSVWKFILGTSEFLESHQLFQGSAVQKVRHSISRPSVQNKQACGEFFIITVSAHIQNWDFNLSINTS